MSKKMMFFDIDGTLIECQLGIFHIPEKTKQALQILQNNGHLVFLATGRCKCFIMDEVMEYPFDGYVTCNGGYVEYQKQEIYKQVISVEALEAALAFCKERNLIYYFEGNDYIYTLNKEHPAHIRFERDWGMKKETVIDVFDVHDIETYIGMLVVNTEEDIPPMVEALSPYFNIQKHLSGLSFDLTVKGVSKAVGIEKLVTKLGRDMKDTIAFGDGRNDIEMLEKVQLGIAMGNGAIEAKDASDYITDRIENEGIIKALRHFNFL